MGFLWNQLSVSASTFSKWETVESKFCHRLNQLWGLSIADLPEEYSTGAHSSHQPLLISSTKAQDVRPSSAVPVINRVWRPQWSRLYRHTASECGHNCSYFLLCGHSGVMYSSNAERWGGVNWLMCGYLWILARASWLTVPCVGGYAFIHWKIYSITSLSAESACLIYPVASVLPRCPWLC